MTVFIPHLNIKELMKKDLNTRNVAPLETGFLEKELAAMKSYKRRRIA